MIKCPKCGEKLIDKGEHIFANAHHLYCKTCMINYYVEPSDKLSEVLNNETKI